MTRGGWTICAFEGPEGPTTFGAMLDATYTDGMFVWKDGRILHESYHNGMDRRSVHLLQSVSKSITATAGASLIAEGLLDPAAPVTDVLPELARTAWKGATLQQVLDMTRACGSTRPITSATATWARWTMPPAGSPRRRAMMSRTGRPASGNR